MQVAIIAMLVLAFSTLNGVELIHMESTNFDVKPERYQDSIDIPSTFHNVSNHLISISFDKPGCSCMVIQLDQQIYLPGQKGELNFHYLFGDLDGERVLTIHLRALDHSVTPDASQDITVTYNIHIPVVVKVSPRRLEWTGNDQVQLKFIRFEAIDEKVTLKSYSLVGRGFEVALDKSSIGKSIILLAIKRTNPTEKIFSAIRVIAGVDDGKEKARIAFLNNSP